MEFSHIFLHEILLVAEEDISTDKEIAFAFTPGEEPAIGKKFYI